MEQSINLQNFTKLPIKVINVGGKPLPDLIIQTPFGDREIKLKEEHYPFIFGSVTQTEKHASVVVKEILEIDREVKEKLLDEWLNNINKDKE